MPSETLIGWFSVSLFCFLIWIVEVVFKNICQFYLNIKVVIADDSLTPDNVSCHNIEHRSLPIMTCNRHHLLTVFLILLGIALSICLFQLGAMDIMKTVISSGSYGIGPFYSSNRSSCSIEGMHTTPNVSDELLKDIMKRRAEEYRQHKIRMGAHLDRLLIAPANSPLQYPITGFTVSPLKKTIIPGLALQTQKRQVYKVSLSVTSGVLSVDDVLDGDQVDGQDQSNLTISSSNLTHLNDLLSRVAYTSTIYHIKTSDFAHFIHEDHEVMFPILIKRQTVPVLIDPGTDVNSQVTIITKTFLRYKELNALIKSIRMYYPDIKIIIADDSLKPEPVTGKNIEHYIMPPTRGWFAGRNLAVSQVDTKYFLWVDDDFGFLKGTRIESFVEIMEAVPELDILGGDVSGNQYYFKFEYEEGDEEEGGCLTRVKKGFHQQLPNFPNCILVDGVVNYFLGRTDAVRRVGFDPYLKRVGHSEFFMDGLGQLLVASCKGLSIGHQRHKPHGKYAYFRTQKKAELRKKLFHHFFKNYLKNIKF
ncbi:beta-1,4 N-acetylgalactosaminyltransferase 1-like [Garra rufa]|uniref:beta-1,4 N-acetylgalactosaminyltransferase 1-like n=1 Tax=Garra rufa TaxID=137080 RepID=UPI003CCEB4F0